jgi:mannose-6-phosphate isomerase-like protein (cupin superfamily)
MKGGLKMSHDKNGTLLNVGDTVMIPAKVTAIHATENGEFCNADMITVNPMPPYAEGTHMVLNTRQTIKFGNA